MAKARKNAELAFLDSWNELGYSNSDIVREYRFHPTRRWRFDFAFPSRKVGIEIDGRGRHQTVIGVRNDCEKHNVATLMGWAILHLPVTDVFGKNEWGEPLVDGFLELVCKLLSTRAVESDDQNIQSEVEQLPSMSTTRPRLKPRTVPRRNPC